MRQKKEKLGAIVNAEKLKEPKVYARVSVGGAEVATDRPDRGSLHALTAPHGIHPHTGQIIRMPPKRVIELLKREVNGKAQDCAVVMTTLRTLYRKGSLTDDQYAIGASFKDAFDYAGLQGMRASDPERVASGSNAGDHASTVAIDAGNYVWRCMDALGGANRLQSRALWCVVGLEYSLRETAAELGSDHKFWSGAVVTGLDALCGLVPVWRGKGA